ncbi:MAG: hypothetical protein U0936_10710 [Planctomycetaceae bacterium]
MNYLPSATPRRLPALTTCQTNEMLEPRSAILISCPADMTNAKNPLPFQHEAFDHTPGDFY